LLITTLVVAAAAVAIPFTPLSGPLGFARLPPVFWPVLAGIVILYIASAEAAKRVFYSRERSREALAPGVQYHRHVR
jgi:Mg2+-importing ATPase